MNAIFSWLYPLIAYSKSIYPQSLLVKIQVWLVKIQFIVVNIVKTQVSSGFSWLTHQVFSNRSPLVVTFLGCYWPRRCPSKMSLGTAMARQPGAESINCEETQWLWLEMGWSWGLVTVDILPISKPWHTYGDCGNGMIMDDLLFFEYRRIMIFMFENSWGNAKRASILLWSEEKYFAILMDRASGGGCSPVSEEISSVAIGEISGT